MTHRDFDDVEHHPVVGMEIVAIPDGVPFGVEAGIAHSRRARDHAPGKIDVNVSEGSLGFRTGWVFDQSRIEWSVGGGWTLLYVDRDERPAGSRSDRDRQWDSGFYGHTAFEVPINEHLVWGLDGRLLLEQLFDTRGLGLDYLQVALRLGYRF